MRAKARHSEASYTPVLLVTRPAKSAGFFQTGMTTAAHNPRIGGKENFPIGEIKNSDLW